VEEEVSSPLSMFLQILPNPSFSRTSSKKPQETESKALYPTSRGFLAVFVSAGTWIFVAPI
jgi:hypothetical protein